MNHAIEKGERHGRENRLPDPSWSNGRSSCWTLQARMVEAYERDPSAPVPWSDRSSVGTVARHVAGTHHVVTEIVRGRPDADFEVFGELQTPAKGAPEFVEWFGSGTTFLLEQLSSVPPEDQCWSWFSSGGRVGWWARRMAFEAVIHRWDTDCALGQTFSMAPDAAAWERFSGPRSNRLSDALPESPEVISGSLGQMLVPILRSTDESRYDPRLVLRRVRGSLDGAKVDRPVGDLRPEGLQLRQSRGARSPLG
jgi:hypothetical protein